MRGQNKIIAKKAVAGASRKQKHNVTSLKLKHRKPLDVLGTKLQAISNKGTIYITNVTFKIYEEISSNNGKKEDKLKRIKFDLRKNLIITYDKNDYAIDTLKNVTETMRHRILSRRLPQGENEKVKQKQKENSIRITHSDTDNTVLDNNYNKEKEIKEKVKQNQKEKKSSRITRSYNKRTRSGRSY